MHTSEQALLAAIDRHFANVSPALELGRGDDCSLLAPVERLCTSHDLFVQDVHFRTSYFSAADVGHKALAVNVSDLAACGARPLAFSLGLVLPGWLTQHWLDDFFSGMAELANRHGLVLCGGDLSAGPALVVDICIFGEIPPDGRFLARGRAREGDRIFIVGSPGLARAGLHALEAHGPTASRQWPAACQAHLRPVPRVAEGLALGRLACAAQIGLMDVSDGLVRDLPRLLGPSLGAELLLDDVCLPEEVLAHAAATGGNALHQALLGGEDYALLGTCPEQHWHELAQAVPAASTIGLVTGQPGMACNGEDLSHLAGFDHFAHGEGTTEQPS